MKKTMMMLIACLATTLASTGAMAETKPFNASITPDIAICDRSDTIEGVTLSIWGENQQTGLAVGFINGSVGHSVGLSAGILNYAENYKGPQFAMVNYTKQDSSGLQIGFLFGLVPSFLNYTGGSMKGLYTGAVNYAGRLTGVHLGLVNYAEDTDDGVQIGIINIINQNRRWFDGFPNELAPAMIFVNWRF